MMAFGHSKLDVLPEEDVLEAIRRGCEEVSVVAHRCDEIEHSGPVTQLMLDEIRKRRFLICDVTHERPNLYYEVGYAHGLGKEVILTAQNDTRIHFDIANYNVIFYSSATELQKRLVKRLKGKMTDEEKEKIN
jgi:nucleoside 2-deoxyribosyltransferase